MDLSPRHVNDKTEDLGLRILNSTLYRLIGTQTFWVHALGDDFLTGWSEDHGKLLVAAVR